MNAWKWSEHTMINPAITEPKENQLTSQFIWADSKKRNGIESKQLHCLHPTLIHRRDTFDQ